MKNKRAKFFALAERNTVVPEIKKRGEAWVTVSAVGLGSKL
jgi:hypothetical protein